MQEAIDAATEGAVWGLAFGAAMVLIRPIRKAARPAARTAIRSGVAASEWVSAATRKGRNALVEIYAEAASDNPSKKVNQSDTNSA
jgi:hypothetical protein